MFISISKNRFSQILLKLYLTNTNLFGTSFKLKIHSRNKPQNDNNLTQVKQLK